MQVKPGNLAFAGLLVYIYRCRKIDCFLSFQGDLWAAEYSVSQGAAAVWLQV